MRNPCKNLLKIHATLLFLLSGFLLSAQEICNNGIDDDLDGAIDINDTDCLCSGGSGDVTSLIPNPSFEAYDFCPNNFSQLNAAQTWIQASWATSDYFNTCGYVPNAAMLPFPDGQGAVGGYICGDYKEYIGACLPDIMQAGTAYTLKMQMASAPSTIGDLAMANGGVITYPAVNITIFGNASCTALPVPTAFCIMDADPSWFVLGYATYTPSLDWEEVTISFTPAVDVYAVIIGAPCELPAAYLPKLQMQSEWGYYPYFYYDKLTLNRSILFDPVTITADTDSCNGLATLTAQLPENAADYTLQWYKDGIAVSGATATNLELASAGDSGVYSLMATMASGCGISNPADVLLSDPIQFSLAGQCVDSHYIIEAIPGIGFDESQAVFSWKDQNGNAAGDDSRFLDVTQSVNETAATEIFPQTYTLSITDAQSACEYSKSIIVENIFCNIPKGISPNGDNKNDSLNLTGLHVAQIEIFNRYGTKVYSRENYTDEWDGKSTGGKTLPDGTYFYQVLLDNGGSRTGWIYLLREY